MSPAHEDVTEDEEDDDNEVTLITNFLATDEDDVVLLLMLENNVLLLLHVGAMLNPKLSVDDDLGEDNREGTDATDDAEEQEVDGGEQRVIGPPAEVGSIGNISFHAFRC